MTNREAVYKAIEQIGYKTSLKRLATRATEIIQATGTVNVNWQLSRMAACILRSQYCKEHNITNDMRKTGEEGSPRRDQLKDTTATLEQVQRLVNYLKVQGNTFTSLLKLVGGDFHSIEQLRHTLEVLQGLQLKMS